MIEKLKTPKHINWDDTPEAMLERHWIISDAYEKINELVDVVNGILDYAPLEMAMKAEPEKCETRAENVQSDTESRLENVPDLDIQLSWIGHLCRFWDYDKIESTYAILDDINVWCEHPYRKSNGNQYKHCEPVKPDDNIIFKGGDNE